MALPPPPPASGLGSLSLGDGGLDLTWLGVPRCSEHSHTTSFLVGWADRFKPGWFTFGPEDVEPGEFHPWSSVYLEGLLVLALPGVVLWLALLTTLSCFCYRRYHIGRCGEPIPTVRAYSPREVALTMAIAALSCALLLAVGAFAFLGVSTAYSFAMSDLISSGGQIEDLLANAFEIGRGLLDSALEVVGELESFRLAVAARIDAAQLLTNLTCSSALLAGLPNGELALRTAVAVGDAISVYPPPSVTLTLFSDLALPVDKYPVQVPPLIRDITTMRGTLSRLPDLPTLATHLSMLNASVVNTTGLPSAIVNGSLEVNSSLAQLPDLELLADRLSRVYYGQTNDVSHICANIPPGWKPGDVTECDRLQRQLLQAEEALRRTDAEAPLANFAALADRRAELPPLFTLISAMRSEAAELTTLPNLTTLSINYQTLETTSNLWSPTAIVSGVAAVDAAVAALTGADVGALVPELRRLQAVEKPLVCMAGVNDALLRINSSLLELPAEARHLHASASRLATVLTSLPSASGYLTAIDEYQGALAGLPSLTQYVSGITALDAAVKATPATQALLDGISPFVTARHLPDEHESVANVSVSLAEALAAIPPTDPFVHSLRELNASRYDLPPLITQALGAIRRYDQFGDDSDMSSIGTARAAVLELAARLAARPDDAHLRGRLLEADDVFRRVPTTSPPEQQVRALDAAVTNLPNLTAYLVGLAALSEATAAMPRVSLLERAWDTLSAAVLAMPKAADTAPKFETYSLLQASLPTPPTALLDPGFELHATLAAVPTRVSHGQHSVQSTHADTLRQLELLEIGMFGDEKLGYTASIVASKPDVDALFTTAVFTSYALPAALALISVLSCAARRGSPALYAGQLLLFLLPWYWLSGASAELPAAVMLQEGCVQLETFTARMLGEAGREYPQFERMREPVYGYMTGCAAGDPMAEFFTPVDAAATSAQTNATSALAAFELREQMAARVAALGEQTGNITATLSVVKAAMACDKVHELYLQLKTAVCCDAGYALTILWVSRLVVAALMIASCISAIAGYKRFRRQKDLWGPYATTQALEVGAYL